jgi:NAD(P)-dependent dehydrogenase (short-subunit alcohol dehydrogenase family)
MSSAPIVLILGAGPNIGQHVARAFAAKGYRIALSSRSSSDLTLQPDDLHIPADLSQPSSVPVIFSSVKAKFGASPSVVIYNAAYRAIESSSDVLSSFDVSAFEKAIAINTTSVLVALQAAVRGFRELEQDASKTFIFTGNSLVQKTLPGFLNFGVAKSATAYALRNLVEVGGYEKEGVRFVFCARLAVELLADSNCSFYFADERNAEGNAVGGSISGAAAAEEYPRIAELNGQGPWMYTFVKGTGYRDFAKTA